MIFKTPNFISFTLTISIILATLQSKIHSAEFSKILTESSQTYNELFDFISSMSFISSARGTTLFSPICCDINLLIQMYQCEFGPEYVEPAGARLEILKTSILNQDSKFEMSSSIYLPSETSLSDTKWEPLFMLDYYKKEDASSVFKKHQEWAQKKSESKISSLANIENFVLGERIYSSFVRFKDLWTEKFEKADTKKNSFTLKNGAEEIRDFMNIEKTYRYSHISNKICNYKMVVLPYGKSNGYSRYNRYMIYLIPDESNVELKILWESFYDSCKAGITDKINNTDFELLKLSIPKMEGLTSTLDLCNIMSGLFKDHTAFYVSSKMKTFLQVDEDGTTAVAAALTCCIDGPSPKSVEVKVNVPYIAFIYDVAIERILFIFKDEGSIQN